MVSGFPEHSVAASGSAEPPDARNRNVRWACSDLLAHKWTFQIVAVLLAGPRRFSTLRAAVPGLSDKVLSQRLRELELGGVVTRTHFPEIPPRVEYALTPAGSALRGVIGELQRWSLEHDRANGSTDKSVRGGRS